jgi:hypothetical protein
MTLTAIFAVACVMLIAPISMIYTHHNELARSQLVADNVAACLRAACTGNNVQAHGDVWIASSGNTVIPEDTSISSLPEGDVLIIRKSPDYCISLASNYDITGVQYKNVKDNDKKEDVTYIIETGSNGLTTRAVYKMFEQEDPASSAVGSSAGHVHYGYFVAGTNTDLYVFPNEYYDFTDPLNKSIYDKYTVDLKFSNLQYDVGTGAPACVNCLITVKDDNGTVYTREIALRLS